MEDRIESLKNQIQILETKVDDEARFSIGLAMAGSQLVDISGNLSRVMKLVIAYKIAVSR